MKLAEVFETALDPAAPVGFTAYDGSAAGPEDPVVEADLRESQDVLNVTGGDIGIHV